MDTVKVLQALDDVWDKPNDRRTYLGASVIGHECDAFLEMTLRRFPDNPIPPRVRRIFRVGHMLEEEVVSDLRKAFEHLGFKIKIHDKNPDTGEQWEYSTLGRHVICHPDGEIIGPNIKMMLEVKTMNGDKWEKFRDLGVRESHPQYYEQVHVQMGLGNAFATLFIAYNKNTSAYWIEIVPFDEFRFHALMARAELAIRSETYKASSTENFRCRFCNKSEVCWGRMEPEKNCYSCEHARAVERGGWQCLLTSPFGTTCQSYEPHKPRLPASNKQ